MIERFNLRPDAQRPVMGRVGFSALCLPLFPVGMLQRDGKQVERENPIKSASK
jgi:hypothetical protein